MASKRGFDAILGVSKKIIDRSADHDQGDEAKDKISSAISRMKVKSKELSDRKLESFTEEPVQNGDLTEDDLIPKASNGYSSNMYSTNETLPLKENEEEPSKDVPVEEMSIEEDLFEEKILNEASFNKDPFNKDPFERVHTEQKAPVEFDALLLDQLKDEIVFLKQQIEVKDKQLHARDQQLDRKDELILNFQVLLKSEQDKVLRLESEACDLEEAAAEKPEYWYTKIFKNFGSSSSDKKIR